LQWGSKVFRQAQANEQWPRKVVSIQVQLNPLGASLNEEWAPTTVYRAVVGII
jgi:hypothetical protein